MEKIVITGGTGFLGLSLANYLKEQGYIPVLVARHRPKADFRFFQWDGETLGDWVKALEGALAIVNLAGKSVNCIKSPDNCDLILRSRVETTKLIGRALEQVASPPKVWVQMSTAHIYGDPPSRICDETSATGYGLAPFVGTAWENAFMETIPKTIRGVRLRTSFVIGKHGGALTSLKRLVKLGLGGRVGKGMQGFSWIHENDLNAIILEAITNQHYNGVYIASSPNPVSNKDFMRELRSQMNCPIGLRAPVALMKFGAKYLLKTDPELALYGRYVKPERLEQEGFKFRYAHLGEALAHLV